MSAASDTRPVLYILPGLLCVAAAGWTTANPTLYRAGLAFQGGLSQNAGCWLRGHLGVSSSRSYPDQETQYPMGSMRLLWLYFGGDAPPTSYADPALAAVMNYEPLPVIQAAAADRKGLALAGNPPGIIKGLEEILAEAAK